MFIYCLIFILLAIIAVEYEFKNVNNIDFILAVIGILLIVFVGFRGVYVSRDYFAYINSFNYIINNHGNQNTTLLPLYEPGFSLIVKACYKFFTDNASLAIMLFFAVSSISIKFFVFRRIAFNPFIVLLLYYSHYFLIQEMTQVRNGLACSFFFLAIYYYLKDKKAMVFISIVLAMMFHNSAVFYFLIFFIKKDKLNAWLYGSIFFAAIILGLIKLPLLSFVLPNIDISLISTRLATYATIVDAPFIEKIRFFNVLTTLNVIVTAYIFFYCVKNKINDNHLTLFLKCNIISIFVYGLLIDVPSMATRVTELFGAIFPLLYAYSLKMPPFKKWNIIFLIGIASIYFYINLFYGKLLTPYEIIRVK